MDLPDDPVRVPLDSICRGEGSELKRPTFGADIGE
jgi:hypothetical protein